jgi:hypothetical protein
VFGPDWTEGGQLYFGRDIFFTGFLANMLFYFL